MKKDIIIPKVENVYVVALQEWNDDFMEKTWYAYLVNDSQDTLESVIVVSSAKGLLNGEERKTSRLRHNYATVAPDTAIKIELIENTVLALDNMFAVTFFKGNTLYDKNFVFKAGSIDEGNVTEVPVIFKEGVLIR